MERISIDIKEKNERDLVEISKMDRAGMAQIDEHLVQPSTQLGTLDIVDAYIGNQLPQLARDCYFSEASCQAEPSQLISQFLDKCRNCIESMKRQAPGAL